MASRKTYAVVDENILDSLSDITFDFASSDDDSFQLNSDNEMEVYDVDSANAVAPIPANGVAPDPANNIAPDLDVPLPPEEQRSRKRTRNVKEWKKNIRKRLRDTGQEYRSTSGKTIPANEFVTKQHKCKLNCEIKLSEQEAKNIHGKFWDLGTWDLQTQFICGSVHLSDVKRRRNEANKNRTHTRTFYLSDKRVCKTFFMQVLQISQGRVQRCIERKVANAGVGSTDQRGHHSPCNKTPPDKISFVKEHINSFPKYVSHYSRKHNTHKKYLSQTLDLATMYRLYKDKCAEVVEEPVSEWVYRNIFNTCFNLSFHRPYTDTCQHCDRMKVQIEGSVGMEKSKIEAEKELHLRRAEKVVSDKNDTITLAKNNPELRAIVFDLQKTLPTPVLTTNVVFYKRQLWCYNLGVHNLVDNKADMFMWHEATAKRGSQEIGSCVLKYVLNLPPVVKSIVAYTDTCGGQNRNEKLAKMWMYIVQNTNIEQVDHKFFESGHSFNACDSDFGVIEKCKKKDTELFVPDSWMNFVPKCSAKFTVHKMTQEDFHSVENMSRVTVVRKKDTDNEPLNWLKIKWMRFTRAKRLQMEFKYNVSDDVEFRVLNFDKQLYRKGAVVIPTELSLLYDSPVPIKAAKVKDLLQLLHFIPTPFHSFYKALKTDAAADDDDDVNTDPCLEDYEDETL